MALVIDSDAHGADTLENIRYGVDTARRAWVSTGQVANTRSWKQLDALRKRRKRPLARLDLPQPRQPQQPAAQRRAAVEPELHAVAPLDRLDGGGLLAP